MTRTMRRLHLSRPVAVSRGPARGARVSTVDGDLTFAFRTRGAWRALRACAAAATTPAMLRSIARAESGAPGVAEWASTLRTLTRYGCIAEEFTIDEAQRLRVVPQQGELRPAAPRLPARTRVRLSRFAHLRRLDDHWQLDSPLGFARVELTEAMLPLIAALHTPQSPATLARQHGLAPSAARTLLATLHAHGMLTTVNARGTASEDRDPILRQWEFADALFLAQHRVGRHDRDVGGKFPFWGTIAPEPATMRFSGTRRIALPRPHRRSVTARDVTLVEAIECRHSIRDYGRRAISLAQLSELLYRSARVRGVLEANAERRYAVSSRPYPSGGGCYPLEIFVVARQCRGLARGVYHYDAVGHALVRQRGDRDAVEALMLDARNAQGKTSGGQVLMVFAARFRRLTWKYRSIALATILKDVGALLQTLYLNATAMGLAPCGVGAGDSLRFANAVGRSLHDVSSVGEFLVGSRPDAR
ncbi:MAG: SagB family peptide dehydrogenase [Gemmatimonadaceae bacterium]|nr:SagB family peptide dehydrogenase [Gemmatimonadaceae bacterium]